MTGDSPPLASPDDDDRRTAPILFLVVAAFVLAAATMLSRVGLALAGQYALPLPDDTGSGPKRLARFGAAIPFISRYPGPTAILVGSSIAHFGVALDTFDARMGRLGKSVTTFSAATPMATPVVDIALLRQLGRAFEAAHQRPYLVLVELTPHMLTESTAAVGGGFHRATLGDLAAIGDPVSIGELALEAPDDGARVAAAAALGTQSPDEIENVLLRRLSGYGRGEGAKFQLQRSIAMKFGGVEANIWNAPARGEPRWLFPESQLAYLQVVRPIMERKVVARADVVRNMLDLNDALELHLDEGWVRAFVREVKGAQAIAKHAVIFIAPRNPDFNLPDAEGAQRLAGLIERVKRETGAPLIDLGDEADISDADFLDWQHLSEHGGRPKFSRALAEGVAAALGSSTPVPAEADPAGAHPDDPPPVVEDEPEP